MTTFLQTTTTFLQVSYSTLFRSALFTPSYKHPCWLYERSYRPPSHPARLYSTWCKVCQTTSFLHTPTNFLQKPPSFLHTPTNFLQTPLFSPNSLLFSKPPAAWGRHGGSVGAASTWRGGRSAPECSCVGAALRLRRGCVGRRKGSMGVAWG